VDGGLITGGQACRITGHKWFCSGRRRRGTGDRAFSRLAVAVGKYWVCKRTAPMVAEALECLGGNRIFEENGLARLYREAPVNSIWEGSGNVVALDVLRALTREPAAATRSAPCPPTW
jgi:alkylation response protein AidB-like acyl-CoA dehydrogenase